jgi:hypothetical protein
MTSGSSRSPARANDAASSVSPRDSRWLMNDRRLSCTKPICVSTVMTWSLRVRLMRSTNALSSVDLPSSHARPSRDEAVRLLAERLHLRRQAELIRRDGPRGRIRKSTPGPR